MKPRKVEYSCTFCERHQNQIWRLVAGPDGVFICNECVGMCLQIFGDELGSQSDIPTLTPASSAVKPGEDSAQHAATVSIIAAVERLSAEVTALKAEVAALRVHRAESA